MPLRRVTLLCHVILIATIAASALSALTPARIALAFALVAPLLATLPGLVRQRRGTMQALAVLLVAYVGGASVEVVARAGAALLVSVTLLVGVLELGLLLALIRRARPHPPGVRE